MTGRKTSASRILIGAAAFLPILSAGCVRARVDQAEAVYTIDPRVILFVSLAAWVSAFAGWMIRRSHKDLGPALMIGGALILLTTLPGLVASWVRVSDDRVEWRRGLVSRSFRFADVDRIESRTLLRRLGSKDDPDVDLLIFLKNEEIVSIRGDRASPLLRASAGEIVKRAKLKGVPINPRPRRVEVPSIDD